MPVLTVSMVENIVGKREEIQSYFPIHQWYKTSGARGRTYDDTSSYTNSMKYHGQKGGDTMLLPRML